MRLIDADALKQDMFRYGEKAKYTVGAIDRIIDNAPTVDTTFKEVVAYEYGQKSVERPQGESIIKCKDCKYQIKEWREDRRMKDKGYWAYGCKHFGEIMGYWGFGGNDNEFCSDAEIKEAEND